MPDATGYYKGKSYSIPVVEYAGVLMAPEVAWAFYRMAVSASEAGLSLHVNSGFRTLREQLALWKKDPDGAARPGHSNHQMGWALDINQAEDVRILPWLRANATRFDFYETVRGEPWHWEWRPKVT